MTGRVDSKPVVFVSYTQVDRPWAEWIAWVLEDAGVSTVLQAWDFAPGENFVARMQEVSVQATHTLAILSPDYLSSRYGEEEWTAALHRGTLLPVRVREMDPPGLLGGKVYVDLVGTDAATARERLLAALSGTRAKPSAEPAFPAVAPGGAAPRFPEALPDIWNVPTVRNPNFTGRDEELASVAHALRSAAVVALTGLGGVGKTELAAQYAHRHAGEYSVVWWLAAESPTTLVRELALLARRLRLPEADRADERAAAEAARKQLERQGGWLLTFDNAANPTVVRPWLPQARTGDIVVTSRYAAWGGIADAERVCPLAMEDAVRLLQLRSGQHDPEAARALAERLGGLPLALEQAGAYLEAAGMPFAEYIELFDARQQELLGRAVESDAPTVAATWELSFRQLQEEAPDAACLLTLAAFLAPDDIPRALFSDGGLPAPLEPLGDALAFNDAIAALARYSLITRTGDAFAVHRLVQAVTRARLEGEELERWAQTAVRLLAGTFDFDDDPRTWTLTGRLLPHVLRACDHARAARTAHETTSRLLDLAGLYMRRRGELAHAIEALRHAVADAEVAHGPEHPIVATRARDLGLALHSRSDLDGGQAALERAVRITENAYGPDHPDVALVLNNLANLLRERGDLDGAQGALTRALTIMEAAHGPDHPDVACTINNLASLLRARGDLDGAREALTRSLAIMERAYGPDHPEVGLVANNLGIVLEAAGELDAARDALKRALRITEAAYGQGHPDGLFALNNLAGALRERGEIERAQAALERALRIAESAYGLDHPDVALTVNNLAGVLQARGDLRGAQEALERALRIAEGAYGADHPLVALGLCNLAGLLRQRGEPDAAEAALRRALRNIESAYGPGHPEAARVAAALAAVRESRSVA